jgi:hypothetical protein
MEAYRGSIVIVAGRPDDNRKFINTNALSAQFQIPASIARTSSASSTQATERVEQLAVRHETP